MIKVRIVWDWAVCTARLMVGVPDYDNYVAHRKAHHPEEPIMTYVESFRERQNARYAVEKGLSRVAADNIWEKTRSALS